MKKQIGLGMVLLLTCCFCIGFLFSNICTLYAAEKAPTGQSQKVTPAPDKQVEKLDFKPLPELRIKTHKPLVREKKLDLKCSIKAFYDQARTKPVTGGIYHVYTAPLPKLIYFDVIVENEGSTDTAPGFQTIIRFDPPSPQPDQTFNKFIPDLGPGESYVFQFYGPPLSPIPSKVLKTMAKVDFTNAVKEDVETNNQCSYQVTFQP